MTHTPVATATSATAAAGATADNASPSGSLAGKRAMATGAGSGIGRATALALAANGATVVVVDIDEAAAAQTVSLIEQAGGTAFAVRADVSTEADCERAVREAVEQLGGIDVLFNNAGIIRRSTAESITVDDWDRVMAVNVRSVFLMCRFAVPVMRDGGGGSIINTGSGWGLKGGGNALSYCASKGAVVNMTRALAIDYGPDNIRVNSVNPGDTDTPMLRDEARQLGQQTPEFLAESADRPLRRMGTPEEIAAAVVWLASDAASFVTGSALVVDGGGIA